MKEKKVYYRRLDVIRNISCIMVLLYHLNILKGGFLAVCTFFALSGYLTCMSALKKEKLLRRIIDLEYERFDSEIYELMEE